MTNDIADDTAAVVTSRIEPRRRPLTAQTVLAIQDYRAYPSVTLLLSTRPGPTLDPADAARLDTLVAEARTRLAAEQSDEAASVLRALETLSTALPGPVERAVALFVSTAQTSRVDLPVEVVDRTVVDPTFATRDLVRALHRTPRHVVLLLGPGQARLLDGAGEVLVPANARFPLTDPQHRPGEQARLRFLQSVDDALGAYLLLHPAPLILAGTQPTLSAFRWMSRNIRRVAGTIIGDFPDGSTDELRRRIRAELEQYLISRQAEAVTLLANRRERGRAVYGIEDAWFAARWERPEMLAVEQGFFYPARLGDDGDTLHPADDPHASDVIDDAVDELIELVLSRGGWVALLADHKLPDRTGVALTLREHRRGNWP
jgi:hypothetical protein